MQYVADKKAVNFATPQGFVWYNDFAETRLLKSALRGLVNKGGFGSRQGSLPPVQSLAPLIEPGLAMLQGKPMTQCRSRELAGAKERQTVSITSLGLAWCLRSFQALAPDTLVCRMPQTQAPCLRSGGLVP